MATSTTTPLHFQTKPSCSCALAYYATIAAPLFLPVSVPLGLIRDCGTLNVNLIQDEIAAETYVPAGRGADNRVRVSRRYSATARDSSTSRTYRTPIQPFSASHSSLTSGLPDGLGVMHSLPMSALSEAYVERMKGYVGLETESEVIDSRVAES